VYATDPLPNFAGVPPVAAVIGPLGSVVGIRGLLLHAEAERGLRAKGKIPIDYTQIKPLGVDGVSGPWANWSNLREDDPKGLELPKQKESLWVERGDPEEGV
jgi:hypothetical protein